MPEALNAIAPSRLELISFSKNVLFTYLWIAYASCARRVSSGTYLANLNGSSSKTIPRVSTES
jgi:hypothetical protein